MSANPADAGAAAQTETEITFVVTMTRREAKALLATTMTAIGPDDEAFTVNSARRGLDKTKNALRRALRKSRS